MTDGARWCGLCLQPVRGAEQEASATSLTDGPAESRAWNVPVGEAAAWQQAGGIGTGQVAALLGAAAPVAPAPEAARVQGSYKVTAETGRTVGEHRMVELAGGQRGWVCRMCDNPQPLTEPDCRACGTSLFSVEAESSDRPQGDPGKALAWSLIPGGGQWYLGMHLQAVARASLVVLTFAAALSFPGRGGLAALRLAMGLLCALLWVVSALDARAVARHSPAAAMLTDRRLLWVAMAVTALLAAAVVLALLMGTISGGTASGGG